MDRTRNSVRLVDDVLENPGNMTQPINMDDSTSFGPFLDDLNMSDYYSPSGNFTFNSTGLETAPNFEQPINDCVVIEDSAALEDNNTNNQINLFNSNSTIVNMPNQFICSQCPTILNESEIRSHISAKHLSYFPFECPTCEKANLKVLATTEADMDHHISTCHSGSNTGFLKLKYPAKEVELNKMIEQCRRFSSQQATLINSMSELRPVLNLLDGVGTLTGNGNGAQNGPVLTEEEHESDNDDDVTINEDVIETTSCLNNSSDGNLSEQPARLETNEQSIDRTISENIPNCENSETPNAILPKAAPLMNISISPEPHNFTEPYVGMDYPGQNALSRKRRLLDNVSDNDSVERREKRRLVMNDKQLESGGCCSRDVNHGNAYGPSQALMNAAFSQQDDQQSLDQNPTKAQTLLDIPCGRIIHPDPKMKISYIYINTGDGYASFKTSDGKKHYYRPLKKNLSDLRRSEPAEDGCYAHIVICSPFATYGTCDMNLEDVIAAGKKFEEFLQDVRSISRIWANGYVEAKFCDYSEFSQKALPQSDFCDKLFGRNRSILECERLEIKSDDWPLSVIMNAARHCKRLILKERCYQKNQLSSTFLDAIYEVNLPKHIDITLNLHYKKSTKQLIEKLTERFKNSTGQSFKFTLFSVRIMPNFPTLKNKYGTLKMKKLAPNWASKNGVLIKQRCFTPVS